MIKQKPVEHGDPTSFQLGESRGVDSSKARKRGILAKKLFGHHHMGHEPAGVFLLYEMVRGPRVCHTSR